MAIVRNSLTCLCLTALAVALPTVATAQIVYLESGGVVVGEGEHFSNRVDVMPQGDSWLVVPSEDPGAGTLNGARGRFVQALPDQAGGGGGPNLPPEVQYQVAINTPGTYQLYLRWANNTNVGGGGNSDSIFTGIVEIKDGAGGQADWYELVRNSNTFGWDGGGQAEVNSAGAANNPITWDIAAPGTYTVRFSQREDGAAVDAFVLQDSSLPAPTGFGPAASLLEGQNEFASLSADADSYVRLGGGQNDDNFGVADSLLVKDSGGGSTTRKSYIRFDISSLQGATLENAQLDLEVSVNNNGGSPTDPTPSDYTINVYGLNDGFGEDWVEGSNETNVAGATPPNPLTWENAPANDTSNNDIDLANAVLLGQFGVPALNPDLENDPILVSFNNLMSIEEDALLNFLSDDTDGLATFILTRDGGSNNLGFASRENSTMMGPTLRAFGTAAAVPEPSSLLIWGLVGAACCVALRFRRRYS